MAYCSNISCPAQMFRWIGHFAGVMDIEGLGEKWVMNLLDEGLISDPAGIYYLTKEQLVALPRMGDKLAEKVLANIEAAKGRGLGRLLFALGIRHVGGEIAMLLADHFGTLDALAAASVEEVAEVEGVGPRIAESVHAYFRDKAKQKIIEKLREAGVSMEHRRAKRVEGPLTGETFVFTGTLAAMPRSRAESIVAGLGAQAVDSVTRKVTRLVAGADPGSKLAKAEGYGIEIMDEAAFLALLKKHGVEV
jgi:DNA ligase (NAD+)